jgi:hypothetical protein
VGCEFSERSLQVCKDFLQTAVIIDDRFLSQPQTTPVALANVPGRRNRPKIRAEGKTDTNRGALNANRLIKSFAIHGIICGTLNFKEYKQDSIAFLKIAKRADIVIIDWEMEEEKNGKHALGLISNLLKDDLLSPQRFRLISIYTGAEDLSSISESTQKHLKDVHSVEVVVRDQGLHLKYHSITIIICAKDEHGIPAHFRTSVVDEQELPDRLISCFSQSIHGILPNTALAALTAIRHSTHKLLALFDKDLDYAFLTHRASLPKPDDASSHLETLIAEEMQSILSSYGCVGSNASFKTINNWLSEKYNITHQFTCTDGTLDRNTIVSCLKMGIQNNIISLKGGKNKLYKRFSHLLCGDANTAIKSDIRLSKLSVLKTRYKNSLPHLTAGVILQQQKDKSLWVCIQPKCDSVRLEKKSKKFPLLPIKIGAGGDNTATLPRLRDCDNDLFCNILIHPKHCRSVEFKSARKDQNQVFPKCVKGHWIFLTKESIQFQFVAELKNEISQNILNDFASTTARVGTNPSEWLRKSGLER